ncbi:MAG: thioesterase family protein [Polyangiaceae bacterium]
MIYRRPVRFEEVDAAGIVFFGHYARYVHEAMEAFFDGIDGGYVGLIMGRRIGFPAVKLETTFLSPLRYGDVAVITTQVARLGTKSLTFHYAVDVEGADRRAAEVDHTVVLTDLTAMRSTTMPPDVRALLELHLAGG